MPRGFLEVTPRNFNPMSVPALSQEARDGVNAALKAMSAWRNEIAETNGRSGKLVIEKMAAAAAALGWPEQVVDAARTQLQSNAEMHRGFERVMPDVRPPVDQSPERSALAPARAGDNGYTADEDAGVREWLEKHPTYGGRGVTIAMLESAQPEFMSAILGQATSLDGHDVPKLDHADAGKRGLFLNC